MKAPLPANEAERLAALRDLDILDTPPERAYDELSTLAARICQTPIALISLVDENRQWFKSRVGLTLGETPREEAFCAHTILQPDLIVVPDASADERFANNPLVTSPPRIRFYAASPLVTTGGHALGTLCVIDYKPRELMPEQAEALRILSHQVMAQILLQKQLAESTRSNAALAELNRALQAEVEQRVRAEWELSKSRERFELAVRGSQDGLWDWDLERNEVYYSPRWKSILGYEDHEISNGLEEWEKRLHPAEREQVLAANYAHIAGLTQHYEYEFRLRHKDGSYRWILSRGVALRDKQGKAYRMAGSHADLTERKQMEAALRLANDRLDLAMRGSSVAIWENDLADSNYRSGRISCINVMEQLGYAAPAEPLEYEALMTAIHPDDRDEVEKAIRAYLAGDTPDYEVEFRARHRDGSYRWILSRGVAVRDAHGQPVRFAGTRIDITDLKRIEEELRQVKEAAEAASQAKSEFLAHVSHEVRTPLNAIMGMNELALDTQLTDQQRKYLTVVQSSSEALLEVIDDLLDFAKIEAGKMELDSARFALRKALRDTLRALAPSAHRKGLELLCCVRSDVPDSLVGDAGRLRQVLTNLVGNAIKFTEHGEIMVEVKALEVEQSDPGRASVPRANQSQRRRLLFSVRDTGIGIPRDKQEKIFQPFEQADTSTTRRFGGTGLGLSIASRLVELMGGGITAESELGRGSTFRFTIQVDQPLHQLDLATLRAPAELHAVRALIVDDNATSRRLLEHWLRGWHIETTAVDDGPAALEALRQGGAKSRPFEVVLLDSRLSGTDALALATQIHQTSVLPACRILLLAVADQAEDLGHCHDGLSACLMKPVMEDELLDAICRARSLPSPVAASPLVAWSSGGDSAKASEANAGIPVSGRRLRVLLAEDNPYNQAVLEDLLPRRGHSVQVASDGRAALRALEQNHFDLMLLDIHMPELDGFQVVAAQRQREQGTGRHLPIIALTARSAGGERERCLQAGMDDYLAKPVRAAALFAAIDQVVFAEGVPRPVESDPGVPFGLLDPAALLAGCDGDEELLRKMSLHFQALVPGRLAEIGEALRDRNIPRLREGAHRLGGMVSSFSATGADAAALVGRLGSEGKIDEAIQAYSQLTEVVGRLVSALDTLSVDQLRRQPDAACSPPRNCTFG